MTRTKKFSSLVGIGVPALLEVAKELHARGVKVVQSSNKDAVILEKRNWPNMVSLCYDR